MKYKKGDKVVVEIDHDDAKGLNDEKDILTHYEQVLGKVEDFKPAQEKIKMTVEETKEFDKLYKLSGSSPYGAFSILKDNDFPILYKKVWIVDDYISKQFEFIRALEHPELIEVVKPKHEFKAGDLVMVGGKKAIIIDIDKGSLVPFLVLFESKAREWLGKEDLTFIKSGAIDWGDGK